MDTDNYAQPLEKVMREERRPRPLPLKARDHMELFEEWVRINPDAMREIELTALAIDARGIRVFRLNTSSRSSVTKAARSSIP